MISDILSGVYYYINPIKIPEIIFYLIGKNLETYLNISDLYNVKSLNKELNQNIYLQKELRVKKTLLSNALQKWKNKKNVYNYFNNTFFPKKLINLLPILPWKTYYVGGTDYIDRIRAKDLTHPIMIGVDHFRRPFITIKYKDFDKTKYSCNLNRGYITVFQRYTDAKQTWVKCNATGPLMIYNGSSTFNEEDKDLFINNIIRLLCGKKIIINNRDSWMSDVQSRNEIDCKLY